MYENKKELKFGGEPPCPLPPFIHFCLKVSAKYLSKQVKIKMYENNSYLLKYLL